MELSDTVTSSADCGFWFLEGVLEIRRDSQCSVCRRKATTESAMTREDHQAAIYGRRFAGIERRRLGVWRVLGQRYFQRWIKSSDAVLDLGAGYCEFINSISAAQKYALDSNPSTSIKAASDVKVLSQAACTPWSLLDNSIDVVFTSNFFEHLPTREALARCLAEAHRVLRPQGLLIALGPNIRFCYDVYWDFVDHHLPLSDRSLIEAMEIAGFQEELVKPRFLPFTMSGRVPPQAWLVRLYLQVPLAQRFWGKQFLIIARKP